MCVLIERSLFALTGPTRICDISIRSRALLKGNAFNYFDDVPFFTIFSSFWMLFVTKMNAKPSPSHAIHQLPAIDWRSLLLLTRIHWFPVGSDVCMAPCCMMLISSCAKTLIHMHIDSMGFAHGGQSRQFPTNPFSHAFTMSRGIRTNYGALRWLCAQRHSGP